MIFVVAEQAQQSFVADLVSSGVSIQPPVATYASPAKRLFHIYGCIAEKAHREKSGWQCRY